MIILQIPKKTLFHWDYLHGVSEEYLAKVILPKDLHFRGSIIENPDHSYTASGDNSLVYLVVYVSPLFM